MRCPNCNDEMEVRTHKTYYKNLFKKPYFFRQWEYCAKCNFVQHFEKFKVYKKDYHIFLIDLEKQKAAERNQPSLI